MESKSAMYGYLHCQVLFMDPKQTVMRLKVSTYT